MHPDSERLTQVPLFAGLSEDERSQLASWLDVEEFDAGKRIAREQAFDYAFFVIDEGTARVEQEGQMLVTLGPGDVFGEMAMLGDGRRVADVIAETDIRILCMFGTRFREMQLSMPEIASRLEELARERARMNSER